MGKRVVKNTFANLSGMPYGKTKEEHRRYFKWWRNLNREEYNKKRLDWAHGHGERRIRQSRDSYLKNRYGKSIEEIEELLTQHKGKCAICATPFKEKVDKKGRKKLDMHIDHNHNTGEVRGLLCPHCNLAIGLLKENIDIFPKVVQYLSDKGVNSEEFFSTDNSAR